MIREIEARFNKRHELSAIDVSLDSTWLFPAGGRWGVFGQPFADYMKDFAGVNRDHVLDKAIARLKTHPMPTVVDLLAPTDTLNDFAAGYLKRGRINGFVAGLHDNRKTKIVNRDTTRGITYLSGDLGEAESWDRLVNSLGGNRAQLVMERGGGGLKYLPWNFQFIHRTMTRIWEILDPDFGVAVLQTPPFSALEAMGVPINFWLQQLDQAGVYVQSEASVSRPERDHDRPYGYLLLQRSSEDQTLPNINLRLAKRLKNEPVFS